MDPLLQRATTTVKNIYLLHHEADAATAVQILRRWRLLHITGAIQLKSLLHLQPGENLNQLKQYQADAQAILLLLSPDTDVETILTMLPTAAHKIFCIYLRPVLDDLISLIAQHGIPIVPTKPITYYTHTDQAILHAERHFFKWLYPRRLSKIATQKKTRIKITLLKILQTKI